MLNPQLLRVTPNLLIKNLVYAFRHVVIATVPFLVTGSTCFYIGCISTFRMLGFSGISSLLSPVGDVEAMVQSSSFSFKILR